MKKPTKTKPPKPAATKRPASVARAWQEDTRASNGIVPTTTAVAAPPPATAAPAPHVLTKAPKLPRPKNARHRRAFLSPAAARGLDAVKFIRIHQRKPYGRRGEQAIIDIVKQAGHLARVELGEIASVEEPK